MKRVIDLSVSLTLLVVLSPLLCLTALVVKIKLGSPVLFKQQRPGQFGAPFHLYKFRSMTDERDEAGNLLPDHLRLTAWGAFLRKYSIDELPQLWNVVKGELSLVGPRPLLMEYLPLYTEEQARRHLVKPGITGWAQIHGRNETTWEERFQLDVWYVDHQSVWLDLKIIALSILKVIRSEGVSHADHPTMPMFEGGYKKHEA